MRRLFSTATLHSTLLLFAGLAVVVLVAATTFPGPWHHDNDEQACRICQVGQLPVVLSGTLISVAPFVVSRRLRVLPLVAFVRTDPDSSRAPRAPPA
jgi:hypothetical protein